MAEMFITHRGLVYPHQCDHMGHMNVMWYVGKFDEATWQMFAALGLSMGVLQRRAWGIAATRQEIAYRQELHAGDVLTIWTGVVSMRPRRIRFYHELYNDENHRVAAATAISGVLFDAQTRKPILFPPEVVQAAQAVMVEKPLLV